MGHIHPIPLDGDSWDYHIPIALSILNGSFITAHYSTISHLSNPFHGTIHEIPQWYYPASSEAINAIFLYFHIPTYANIFAVIVLFFCLWKLALTFQLSRYYSLLFATSFCTLNVVLRWLNAVSIDTWLAVWFTLSIILLELPQKNVYYFAKLGFVLGMLIGSKYTALYFTSVLAVFYLKKILPFLSLRRILVFLIPFTIFGLCWYIRNYLLTGNPFYPLPRLGFSEPLSFSDTVWIETIHHPLDMINAAFGEYHMWILSVPIAFGVVLYRLGVKRLFHLSPMHTLFIIGLINFAFYCTFPTSAQSWIMVSSLRYSFPAFIPLMLGMFLLAKKYKKEEVLGYIVIANMINVLTMAYYPKLILFYLPAALALIYFLKRTGNDDMNHVKTIG